MNLHLSPAPCRLQSADVVLRMAWAILLMGCVLMTGITAAGIAQSGRMPAPEALTATLTGTLPLLPVMTALLLQLLP
jgi:hypothetical protein